METNATHPNQLSKLLFQETENMIRKTILAIAAAATIAGAASTAQATYYGYGYHKPIYTHGYTYQRAYYTKCFKKIVGYKRIYKYYGGYYTKPIFRRVCKRFYY